MAVLLAACDSAPSSPSAPSSFTNTLTSQAVTSPLAGDWRLGFRVGECRGSANCVAMIGTLDTLTLRLSHTGRNFSGTFASGCFVVPVSGQMVSDGRVSLTSRGPSRDSCGLITVHQLDLSMDPNAGLAGRVRFELTPAGIQQQSIPIFVGGSIIGAAPMP